jgi:hypothetical protein
MFLALFTVAGCSGSGGAVATTGSNAAVGIEVAQTFVTLENRTGSPLVEGQMEIRPVGVLPPFKALLPRIETGAKREIPFNAFRGNDGSPFSRQIARARSVKVTAKDVTGKVYENEVPFD